MEIVYFILIGIVAGISSGMFGIGGGIIMVPAMVLLMGLNQHLAIGTSLGALIPAVGIFGAIEYYKRGHLNIKYALLLALGIYLGAYLGAKIVGPISNETLRRLFAAFLVIVGIKMWMGK